MTEANRVLMEQALYGILDYDISGSDYLVEAMCRYIDNKNPANTLCEVLTESVIFDNEYSKFLPLMEAVDKYKKAEKEIKDLEKDVDVDNIDEEDIEAAMGVRKNALNKIGDAIKKAAEWWYDADPSSKGRTLRVVSKLVLSASSFVVGWHFGVFNIGALARSISTAASFIPGINKLGDIKIGKKKLSGSKLFMPKIYSWWGTENKFICNSLDIFIGLLNSVDNSIYMHINSKDIDANIEKFQNIIDDCNAKLDELDDPNTLKAIEKTKYKTERCLAELNRIKTATEKKKNMFRKVKNVANGDSSQVDAKIEVKAT